jgi:hypothetical protein
MAAGVTGKPWEISDIVEVINAKEAENPTVGGEHRRTELRKSGHRCA